VLGVGETSVPPVILLEVAAGGDLNDWYGKQVDPVLQWKVARYAEGMAGEEVHYNTIPQF
jgi:hypothetical protein